MKCEIHTSNFLTTSISIQLSFIIPVVLRILWSYFWPIHLFLTLSFFPILNSSIPHFNHCITDILNSFAPLPFHYLHMQIPTLAQSNYITMDHWTWLKKNHPLGWCYNKFIVQNIWVTEANTILKENKVGRLMLPDFKTYYTATIITKAWR